MNAVTQPFEVHLTSASDVDREQLHELARQTDGRVHNIELIGGKPQQAIQPMVTWVMPVQVPQSIGEVTTPLLNRVRAHGMVPLRCKVETFPTADLQALYYESHLLLRSSMGANVDGSVAVLAALQCKLADLFHAFQVHVSRSLRLAPLGACERYLTRRDRSPYQIMMRTHAQWLQQMTEAIAAFGQVDIVKVEHEAVLYDSNERLDQGWQ